MLNTLKGEGEVVMGLTPKVNHDGYPGWLTPNSAKVLVRGLCTPNLGPFMGRFMRGFNGG